MVRRRLLYRYRRYAAFNRWNKLPPIYDDHTKEPFVDVSVSKFGSASSEIICLWAVSVLGQIYFRSDITPLNPEGYFWNHVPIPKGLEACQVSVSSQGVPFVVTWTGSFLFRVGQTPHNLAGTDWVEISGPSGGLFQVSVGDSSMWALTRDKKCWTLKSTVQSIFKSNSTTTEWLEIPGKMRCISVSRNDQTVLAVFEDDGILMVRHGITEDQKHGQQWKQAFQDVAWDTVSTCSKVSEISDCVDGGGSGSGDTSSSSIRPDLPGQSMFNLSGGSEVGEGSANLCWIDGSCCSVLRSTRNLDGDLEVGPWREEIVSSLHNLKVDTEKFPFPAAVEANSSSWSKSVKARMTYKSKKGSAINGELEISNNDTLVFHKGMNNSWICSVRDVLSVLLDSEANLSFSLRIRNSFEDGRAEIISFRFKNEKECEEWRMAIAEISVKSQEICKVANLWVTTEAGEVHQGGQLNITDNPSEMEVVSPGGPSDTLKYQHPLVQGFFPGSELRIEVKVPQDANRFSFNFKGRDCTVFHFNARLDQSQVVRNTFDKGEWGEEERDGVFPFIKGEVYNVLIQCTDTHWMTTVTKKNKYIFSFKHRMLPRLVQIFEAVGDINVISVRYDPAHPEDSERLEFASNPIPGHFWKVAAGSNGMVWGITYDMAVWAYLLNSRKTASRWTGQEMVCDEKIFYTYENQRWNPISGFTAHGLPTDRQSWTDETGRINLEKDDVKLPSCKWTWVTDWEVDFEVKDGTDKDGWQYAIDFPASYHPKKRINDFARRRRWKRVCKYEISGPWSQVKDIKLVDICVWMNEQCDWELLGLCQNGDVVVRKGITDENPKGDYFEPLENEKGMVSVSAYFAQKIWAVGKDGFAYIKWKDHWQLLDRPKEGPLKVVKVGPNCVWGLGTNKVLWRRTDMQPVFPEGRDWAKVCDGVYDVSHL